MTFRMRIALGPVCLLAAATGLWAHQPSPVDVTMESILARRGESYLRLTNATREVQTMALSAGDAGTISFRPARGIVLSPGSTLDVNLGELAMDDGLQVLHVVTTVEGAGAGPALHEVLIVDRAGITRTTYERAFLGQRTEIRGESVPLRVDIGGGYFDAQPMARFAFASGRLPEGAAVEIVDEVSTFELSNMRLRELPEDGGATLPTTRMARTRGEERAGVFGSIQGKFNVKLPGANGGAAFYQAAWGWKVRVWQFIGGIWFQIGSASVKSDGTWLADYTQPPLPGIQVHVEYQPANRFFQVQDANGDIYTWFDDWNWDVTDTGFRVADLTKSGNAPGIDRIYQGGMALWRKFKKYGMNALRDEPVQITYPNTMATGKCQSTDKNGKAIAWSCSQSGDGKIWLISAHAVAGVVQHELAHSIHSYYWDGNMPAGSGGKHNITKCYNAGLALTEGFADFMPYWVQFDRTAVNPVEAQLGMPIDTLGNSYCKGASNEAQVAATFWDVYDTTNDGTAPLMDSWYFTKAYAPVSIFLKNPGHNSMLEFVNVYVNILGSGSAPGVTNLFLWNNMFLP